MPIPTAVKKAVFEDAQETLTNYGWRALNHPRDAEGFLYSQEFRDHRYKVRHLLNNTPY